MSYVKTEEQADEVAKLLVRVYELHETVISENCGYHIPAQLPTQKVFEFCVSVAEENLRRSPGEIIQPRSISEIAKWFQELLGIASKN
jgi:hypothetical protein